MSTIIDGLSLGSIYALIALGYTMVYGIAKLLNFAHGDIIMVGAYAVFVTLASQGHIVLAIAISIIVCVVLGVFIEKFAYKPLRGASPLAVLITAIGVSYLLQSVAQLVFGSKANQITIFNFGNVEFLGQTLKISTLISLGIAAIIMVGLTLFIKKSKVGKAMIAVSEDRSAAELMGINVNVIISVTFAIGSCLAAVASLFYIVEIMSVSPTLGAMPGIKAFTAAVIGGIGSIPGAMLGGILLGVVEMICQSIPAVASYTTAIEFGILIIILLIKPTGFLGKTIREKV